MISSTYWRQFPVLPPFECRMRIHIAGRRRSYSVANHCDRLEQWTIQPAADNGETTLLRAHPETPPEFHFRAEGDCFVLSMNAPPPNESTEALAREELTNSCKSMMFEVGERPFPSVFWKISGIVRPSRAWIRSSRSTKIQPSLAANARPTVVLPAPIKPTKEDRGLRACTGRRVGAGAKRGFPIRHYAVN